MSAGYVVTALYEIVPQMLGAAAEDRPHLRYREPGPLSQAAHDDELLHVAVRYKQPEGISSQVIERVLRPSDVGPMSPDFSVAASLALFGMLLRRSPHSGDATVDDAIELARVGFNDWPDPERAELVDLTKFARPLMAARHRE